MGPEQPARLLRPIEKFEQRLQVYRVRQALQACRGPGGAEGTGPAPVPDANQFAKGGVDPKKGLIGTYRIPLAGNVRGAGSALRRLAEPGPDRLPGLVALFGQLQC